MHRKLTQLKLRMRKLAEYRNEINIQCGKMCNFGVNRHENVWEHRVYRNHSIPSDIADTLTNGAAVCRNRFFDHLGSVRALSLTHRRLEKFVYKYKRNYIHQIITKKKYKYSHCGWAMIVDADCIERMCVFREQVRHPIYWYFDFAKIPQRNDFINRLRIVAIASASIEWKCEIISVINIIS